MSVYQISRMQHRRGKSGELPDALAEGEIGMTVDTGEVFIGAPNHPSVSSRNSYPYHNIKILTELDVQYGITGDVYHSGPLKSGSVSGGQNKAIVPLFPHGQRQFANYDFSIINNDGTIRLAGMLVVTVHPTAPSSSVVAVVPGSISYLPTWTAAIPVTGIFTLSNVDDTGFDSGITWLRLNNNFVFGSSTQDLTVTISGREWTTPT